MFKLTHKAPSWDDILNLICIHKKQQEQLCELAELLHGLSERVCNIESALVSNANIIEMLIKEIPEKRGKNGKRK